MPNAVMMEVTCNEIEDLISKKKRQKTKRPRLTSRDDNKNRRPDLTYHHVLTYSGAYTA
jgi:hypothetical protein